MKNESHRVLRVDGVDKTFLTSYYWYRNTKLSGSMFSSQLSEVFCILWNMLDRTHVGYEAT